MIIGIATLIMTLFGGGSLEVFYIDKIEQGVNKYVTDKDRKKELQANFKDYSKTYKAAAKEASKHMKEFKKQNLDRTVQLSWYEDFFVLALKRRVETQTEYIQYRLDLQETLTDKEWDQIMNMAEDAEEKQREKQARKKKDNDLFDQLRKVANENMFDPDARRLVLDAWDIFKENHEIISEAYDNINVVESKALVDQSLSREQMVTITAAIDAIRVDMYKGYLVFLAVLKAHTSDGEYKAIMKEFNKLL